MTTSTFYCSLEGDDVPQPETNQDPEEETPEPPRPKRSQAGPPVPDPSKKPTLHPKPITNTTQPKPTPPPKPKPTALELYKPVVPRKPSGSVSPQPPDRSPRWRRISQSQPSTPVSVLPENGRPVPPPRRRRTETPTESPTKPVPARRVRSADWDPLPNRPLPPPRIKPEASADKKSSSTPLECEPSKDGGATAIERRAPQKPLPYQSKLTASDSILGGRSASDSMTQPSAGCVSNQQGLPVKSLLRETMSDGSIKSGTFPKQLVPGGMLAVLMKEKRKEGVKRKVSVKKKTSKSSFGIFGSAKKGENSDDEDAKIKTSPSIRKKIHNAFSALKSLVKVRSSGGLHEDAAAADDVVDEEEQDTVGKLNFVPKLKHLSSTMRKRSPTMLSDTSMDSIDEDGRQLFQYVWVIQLKKNGSSDVLEPSVEYRFPPKFASEGNKEEEMVLGAVPAFCFPDVGELKPVESYKSETYSFVLTDVGGEKRFGYCRRLLCTGTGPRLPIVYCIISPHGCFDLYSKILDVVEHKLSHGNSAAYYFLKSVIAKPFPLPGKSVKVQSFSVDHDGMEILKLRRPLDSARLEHVDFEPMFSVLGVDKILTLFSALLMERHIIFSAKKLSTLSNCVHASVALLYPFSWQHVFIPVLPRSLLDFCGSPSPYIIGILASAVPELEDQIIEDDVLILDLDSAQFKQKAGDEANILPAKLKAALKSALKAVEGKKDSYFHEEHSEGSVVVEEAFVRFFVESIGHYHDFLPKSLDKEFDMPGFCKAVHSKGLRQFLENFKNTQMFNVFVDDRRSPEERETFENSLFEQRLGERLKESGGASVMKSIGEKFKKLKRGDLVCGSLFQLIEVLLGIRKSDSDLK
eukprot:m.39594 g.39594  ORF g.39594 m.39594 type:complete len:861 (+) comp32763_c0_seq1:143-2725(+)